MKNATKYLVVGSLGVLMTRRDILSLAVKGLNACPHRQFHELPGLLDSWATLPKLPP